MKLTTFAATLPFLLWGMPAFAQDPDGDGFDNAVDNCDLRPNPDQNDSDADLCGNVCDADYDQSGVPDFGDFGAFILNFGCNSAACEKYQHVEPIGGGRSVGFGDFGVFLQIFGILGPC